MSQMSVFFVPGRGTGKGLPVPQLWVVVLSSGNDTEVNGMERVEEGVGF